jgi:hypothetical protein
MTKDDIKFYGTVIGCSIAALLFLILWGCYMYFGFTTGLWQKELAEHFCTLVVLPFTAAGAFIVVGLLRVTLGPIEFEVTGLKFKGASGPILLWCLAFSTVTAAVKLLW